MLISAVMSILEDFGSLLPARFVAVKATLTPNTGNRPEGLFRLVISVFINFSGFGFFMAS